jgi:hypothetical protein
MSESSWIPASYWKRELQNSGTWDLPLLLDCYWTTKQMMRNLPATLLTLG